MYILARSQLRTHTHAHACTHARGRRGAGGADDRATARRRLACRAPGRRLESTVRRGARQSARRAMFRACGRRGPGCRGEEVEEEVWGVWRCGVGTAHAKRTPHRRSPQFGQDVVTGVGLGLWSVERWRARAGECGRRSWPEHKLRQGGGPGVGGGEFYQSMAMRPRVRACAVRGA